VTMARIPKIIIVIQTLLMCIGNLCPAATQEVAMNQSVRHPSERPSLRMPIITVVYDNNAYGKGLETAWGFSCLVEGMEKTVLFDTGGEGKILLANMDKLGIAPQEIDAVVVSHIHGDHAGGLHSLLTENRRIVSYLPGSFPEPFFRDTKKRGSRVIAVSGALKICDGVYSTGELGTLPVEQSLVVRTAKGLVIITGCAHPGIEKVVRTVKERFGGAILLVLGGFHLTGSGREEIEAVIASLKALGVRHVAPCHCTGDTARKLFKKAFGAGFVDVGVGKVIGTDQLR
jgi:7,8-dihydropterin-6-yl-methyl-4-(beta-D-ribofuranosyl)aminobenzene 5'-phosphate synthase